MNKILDFESITKICEVVERECGVYLDLSKEYLLSSRLAPFFKKHKIDNSVDIFSRILSNKSVLAEMIELLTTNETYWFRDDRLWDVFQRKIIVDMVGDLKNVKKRNINIWSAACSTGQEPYSIAMSIMNEIRRQGLSPDFYHLFKIVATDISEFNLKYAQDGIYSDAQIQRGASDKWMKYFVKQSENSYKINNDLKRIVEFKSLNLMSPFHYDMEQMDIVFCRNVLIYFRDDVKNNIIRKMYEVVKDDGLLVLGSTEAIFGEVHFTLDDCYNNLCYKKRTVV